MTPAPPQTIQSRDQLSEAGDGRSNGLHTKIQGESAHEHEPSSTTSTDETALRFILQRKSRNDAPDATPRARDPARAGIGASFTLCPRGYAVITAIANPAEDGLGSRLCPGDLIVAVDGHSIQVRTPPAIPARGTDDACRSGTATASARQRDRL